MIPGSLLLILVAVVLLALGLVNGSNPDLVGSIVASLLGAVAVIVGSRRARPPYPVDDPAHDDELDEFDTGAARRRAGRDSVDDAPRRRSAGRRESFDTDDDTEPTGRRIRTLTDPTIPAQAHASDADRGGSQHAVMVEDDDDLDEDDDDPPDEPGAQQVSPGDSARVAQLGTDVLVIDGRPRYHLPGCVHLLGRESEPLPVAEAIELGFTPCGLCEPDSALLAEARRV